MQAQRTLFPRLRVGCCLAVILAAGLSGCSGEEPVDAARQDNVPAVTFEADVLTVEPTSWPEVVRTQGTLVSDEVAVVGPKVEGRVAQVHVDLGDAVKANEPLLTLDQDEFKLAVAQAEAQLLQARSAVGLKPDAPVESLDPVNAPPVKEQQAVLNEARTRSERYQQLLKQRAVTQIEAQQYLAAADVAQARYNSAVNSVNEKIALIHVRMSELDLARQRLEETVVLAPFDGVVQQRQAAPGGFVSAGEAAVTMVRTDPLWYRGTIPERYALQLLPGREVTLKLKSKDCPCIAKVTRISPAINELSRALTFEAEVPNPDGQLKAGLFVEADVVIDPSQRGIVLPLSAVTEFAGVEKVWKVVGGKAVEQVVLTGARRDDLVEIREGLAAGDEVLTDASLGQLGSVTVRSRTSTASLTDLEPTPETKPLQASRRAAGQAGSSSSEE